MKKRLLFIVLLLITSIGVWAQEKIDLASAFSDGGNETWFMIQFANGGNYLASNGSDQKVTTAAMSNDDSHWWKFVGTKEKFQLVSKDGYYATISGSRLSMITTEDSYGFSIAPSTNTTYSDSYEIQWNNKSGNSLNQWGGAGAGREIGLWTSGDNNNPLYLIKPLDLSVYNKEVLTLNNVGSTTNSLSVSQSLKVYSAETNSDDKAQLWYVASAYGNTIQLRNLATGKYLQGNNNKSSSWTLSDDPVILEVTQVGNNYAIRQEGHTNSHGYLHIDGSGNAVSWTYSGNNYTQWTITEVSVDQSEIDNVFNALDNKETYKTALGNLFADDAYTTLKDEYANLSQTDMEANSDYKTLSATLQDMVLKRLLASEEWDAYGNFRIAEYDPYCPVASLQQKLKTSDPYNQWENPTGIYLKKGELCYVAADIPEGETVGLKIKNWGGYVSGKDDNGSDTYTQTEEGSTYSLRNGLNLITASTEGNVFVDYYTENYKTASNVTLHFINAPVRGYWDQDVEEKADWATMLSNIEEDDDNSIIIVRSKHAQLAYPVSAWKAYCSTTENLDTLMNFYEDVQTSIREMMGVTDVKNRQLFYATTYGFMAASGHGAYCHVNSLNAIMTPDATKFDFWGVGHEWGHNNQITPGFKWSGCGETTNNIYASWAQLQAQLSRGISPKYLRLEDENSGINDYSGMRGGRMQTYFEEGLRRGIAWQLQDGPDYHGATPGTKTVQGQEYDGTSTGEVTTTSRNYDHFVKLVPFWQLNLWGTMAKKCPNIIPMVIKSIRTTEDYASTYNTNGKQQINWMKLACDNANLNLLPFFKKAGMLKLIDAYIEDYSAGWLKISEDMITALENEVNNYPAYTEEINYINGHNYHIYRDKQKLSVPTTLGEGCTYNAGYVKVEHSKVQNAVAFETYNINDKLIRITMYGLGSDAEHSYTQVLYPGGSNDADAAAYIMAVGYNGTRERIFELNNKIAEINSGKKYLIECPLFYKVQGVHKGIYVDDNGEPAWGTIDTDDDKYYWIIEKHKDNETYSFKNVGTEKYLNGTSMSDEQVFGSMVSLNGVQFNIKIKEGDEEVTVHANSHSEGNGSGGSIVSWGGGPYTASSWRFLEPIDVEYNYTYNGVTKYTESHKLFHGDKYPEPTKSYYGIKVPTVGGFVSESEIQDGKITKNIILTPDLPFQLSENFENAKWYKMVIRNNKYVKREENKVSCQSGTLPTDDNGLWAFMGNPIDGIIVLNKGAGDGYTLGTTVVMQNDNETKWIIAGGNDGFTLRQGTKQYINDLGSNGTLGIWNDTKGANDIGSSFNVFDEVLTWNGGFSWIEPEEADVPAGVSVCSHQADNHVVKMAMKDIVANGDDINISFRYTSGKHKLVIVGVDLVKDGKVVYSDYHKGETGSRHTDNTYRLLDVESGEYILRYFVCNATGNHELTETNGYICMNGAIQRSYLRYTITDNAGNVFEGTYEGTAESTVPSFTGTGYTLSNTAWNAGNFTATIEFPVPVSSESVTNATMISSFKNGGGSYSGAGRFKWYAEEDEDGDDDVKILRDASVTRDNLKSYSWAIYPELQKDAFVFSIKSIKTGGYIEATKDFGSNDGDNDEGTVILSENPTKFSVDGNNSLYFYAQDRNQYLSWGSVNNASGFLGVHTKTVTAGHNGITNSFHAAVIDLASKDDFVNGEIYTFVTARGWMGAKEDNNNVISTAKASHGLTGSYSDPMFQWTVYKSKDGYYYLYNLGKQQFMGVQSSTNASIPFVAQPEGKNLTFKDNGQTTGYPIMFSTDNAGVANHSTSYGDGFITWTDGWNTLNDDGSNHKVSYVGKLSDEEAQAIADKVEFYLNNVTALDQLSNTATYKVYGERGFIYATEGGDLKGTNQHSVAYDETTPYHHFAILKVDENYYLYNVGAKKFVIKNGNTASLSDTPARQTFAMGAASNQNTAYDWVLRLDGTLTHLSNAAASGVYVNNGDEDGGTRWAIFKVGDFNPDNALDVINTTLNMSKEGQFFRVAYDYGNAGKLYMQSTASSVKGLEFTAATDAASIWVYYDGALYSYTAGQCLREIEYDRGLQAVGGKTTATFRASSRAKGKYTLQCGSYVHANNRNDKYYTDHCSNDDCAQHDLILEEVTSLPFTFKSAALGFATFNAPVAVQLPDGVKAYTSSVDEGNSTLTLYELEGNVIPAETAVLLYNSNVGDADVSVELAITDVAGVKYEDNSFTGTIAAEPLKDDKECYSLQKIKNADAVGFCKKSTGTKGGFKAWLELDKSANSNNARTFTIIFDGDNATGLKEALGLEGKDVEIYDLSGRRLDKAGKGIFIVNGKKIVNVER